MTQFSQVKDWISIAIQQTQDNDLEMFYYDTSNKQFFSILILDLYLFDKKMNLIDGISMYYSKEELKLLKDRVTRIFKEKSSIITLPKHGVFENTEQKNQLIDTFITHHKIDLKTSSVLMTLQKEPIPFTIKTKHVSKPWWKIW